MRNSQKGKANTRVTPISGKAHVCVNHIVSKHAYQSVFLILSKSRPVDPQFLKKYLQESPIVHVFEGTVTAVIMV